MTAETGFNSAVCPEYEALLEDYLGGNLRAEDSKGVAAHCEVCAGCRCAMEEGVASSQLLRLARPAELPGPAFARIVTSKIRAMEEENISAQAAFWQPILSLAWRTAATAALALGILLTYDVGWTHRAQPNIASVRPIEAGDILSTEPAATPVNGDEVLMMVAETDHADY